jgi:hypothetical protein
MFENNLKVNKIAGPFGFYQGYYPYSGAFLCDDEEPYHPSNLPDAQSNYLHKWLQQ